MAFQDTLPSGSVLVPNPLRSQLNSLVSLNDSFELIMQQDGNLVLYKIDPKNQKTSAIWASNTNGRTVGQCVMQTDGNLVIYTPDNNPIWASFTNGNNGSYLVVQNDGNVVIYTPDNNPIWATGTQGR